MNAESNKNLQTSEITDIPISRIGKQGLVLKIKGESVIILQQKCKRDWDNRDIMTGNLMIESSEMNNEKLFQPSKLTDIELNRIAVSFDVSLNLNEDTERLSLNTESKYRLHVLNDCLVLEDSEIKEPKIRWYYDTVRKYGRLGNGFAIVAGRRSKSGEGTFVFLHDNPAEIAKAVDEIIKRKCKEKMSVKLYSKGHPNPNLKPETSSSQTLQESVVDDTYINGCAFKQSGSVIDRKSLPPPHDAVLYDRANPTRTNAWKSHGLENEEHRENSKVLEAAANQKGKQIIDADFDSDFDDTYDHTIHNTNKHKPNTSTNVYGIASGKDVSTLESVYALTEEPDYETV